MVSLAKRILIGRPIATADEGHQRLPKRVALPIFASDAISSTAYATDEIVLVLVAQAGIGLAAFQELVPLAVVVCVLLVIVVLSYRQTIYAYPSGGGAYVVARRNLGEMPSLVAGASLLTDYILTVAVSVAGGVLAIQSAFGFDSQWRVPLGLLMIALMTLANLRGLKESGALFAPPTYLYIVMLDAVDRRRAVPRLVPRPRPDPARHAVRGGPGVGRGQRDAERADAAARVLVRRRRAVGRRGRLQRRAGVPQAGGPQRGDHAGDDGGDPRRVLPRHLRAGVAPRADPRRGRSDRHRPDGRAGLRRQGRALLDHPVGDVRHPRPRRQHRLPGLPRALVDHRPRRLPSPPARQPR